MKAFFKLIRWQNLLFIFITQVLFEYCVIIPTYAEAGFSPALQPPYIFLLALSSVLIAAGGNIINDYFDVNIDLINKPEKLIIGKYIHRHWAILFHILSSVMGVALGFWIEHKTGAPFLGITNFICVVLLFVYSIVLKRKPLSGNLLIAILTAWTVMVVAFCQTNFILDVYKPLMDLAMVKIFRLTFLYAGFAFIISLVREMVKDMEDVEGDRRYNCRTFPILFGMNAAKIYSATWLSVLIVLVLIMIFYILQFQWWIAALYCLIFILIPSLFSLNKLLKTNNSKDFHALSNSIKWIMLTGILSLIFLLIRK